MQEVNQHCKTENPELTLKWLCHLQMPLHSSGGFHVVLWFSVSTPRLLSYQEVWRRSSQAFISQYLERSCLLLSIHRGHKQFVWEAFWIYKMPGDQNLPHKPRLQLVNAEILCCASCIMDGSGLGKWKVAFLKAMFLQLVDVESSKQYVGTRPTGFSPLTFIIWWLVPTDPVNISTFCSPRTSN